jgi:hypothetical protein
MAITASAPALYENGAGSNDLEDITHSCVQCGMTLFSTRRRTDSPVIYEPPDGHRYRVQPICELCEASARELD